MEPISEANDTATFKPQIYKVDSRTSLSLFPVPQDNAVGTNDYANAITVISFPEGKINMDNHFRRAVDNVRGGGTYLPVVEPDTVGFGQTRRFLLYNFGARTHEEYRIVFSIEESIKNIAIADARKRRFLFEVKEYNRHSDDPEDSTYFLQLIDLGEKKIIPIKKIDNTVGATWVVAYDRVFLWYFTEKEMQVYDLNLNPAQHPLGSVIMRNRSKVDFTRMVPHPTLPFAILAGSSKEESLISWGEGRAKTPQPILSNGHQFSFSPDGKWVTFIQEDYKKDKKMTYIMPVSEKYPNYLGTPILLLDNYFGRNNFAWTKNPVSFVGADVYIYRWELTNAAHPESDKPTFHDYIVEKDLERLAKEKKK